MFRIFLLLMRIVRIILSPTFLHKRKVKQHLVNYKMLSCWHPSLSQRHAGLQNKVFKPRQGLYLAD